MKKSDYELWLLNKYGFKNKLTKREYKRIIDFEKVIHQKVPDDLLIKICGGMENIVNLDIAHNYLIITELANIFKVPKEVILYKLEYVMKKYHNNSKERILKKDKNIIYVDFSKKK